MSLYAAHDPNLPHPLDMTLAATSFGFAVLETLRQAYWSDYWKGYDAITRHYGIAPVSREHRGRYFEAARIMDWRSREK